MKLSELRCLFHFHISAIACLSLPICFSSGKDERKVYHRESVLNKIHNIIQNADQECWHVATPCLCKRNWISNCQVNYVNAYIGYSISHHTPLCWNMHKLHLKAWHQHNNFIYHWCNLDGALHYGKALVTPGRTWQCPARPKLWPCWMRPDQVTPNSIRIMAHTRSPHGSYHSKLQTYSHSSGWVLLDYISISFSFFT